MTEILFYISIAVFAVSLASFIMSNVEKVKESKIGIFFKGTVGEFCAGIFALGFAIILKMFDTGIEIMLWTSVLVFATSIVAGALATLRPYKKRRILSFTKILPVGMYFAGFLVLFALYYWGGKAGENEMTGNIASSLLVSFHHTFRLFTLDGAYPDLASRASGFESLREAYVIYLGTLYVAAALTTFTVLLNIIKNINARMRYNFTAITFWREVHVFSSLTDESFALACSMIFPKEKLSHFKYALFLLKKPVIIFASTSDGDDKVSSDLIEKAKECGAILFAKDISFIRFRKTKHFYYVMGTNEGEKLRQSKDIIEHYGAFGNKLYVFSETSQSEMFLNSLEPERMQLVRVNAIQSLIYRALYDNGDRLFRGAAKDPLDTRKDGDRKLISAVIVGLGMYGKEMLKALTWFCQMDGYRLEINAFDSDPNAESKLRHLCPEMMSMSGKRIKDEACYDINIHTCNIESQEFYDCLASITSVGYVFVCLGDDEVNLQISKSIRELYAGLRRTGKLFVGRPYGVPDIETVIYDSRIAEKLSTSWKRDEYDWCDRCTDGGKNFKHEPYRIHVIGDLKSFYSARTLTGCDSDNDLVSAGVLAHKRWVEANFSNTLYRKSVIRHVMTNSTVTLKGKEGEDVTEPVIWAVLPKLNFTPPTVTPLRIDLLKNGCFDELHVSEVRGKELVKALFSYLKKKVEKDEKGNELLTLTDDDWAMITAERSGFCLVYDVLSRNYDLDVFSYRDLDELKQESKPRAGKRKKAKKDDILFDTVALTVVDSIPSDEVSKAPTANGKKGEKRAEKKSISHLEKRRARLAERKRREKLDDDEKKFWRYSYYYRSSLSKAIHEKLRLDLSELGLIQSAELKRAIDKKDNSSRTADELLEICRIEHVRWNAFMRAEGYSHSSVRFDLAKLHHNLVPTSELGNDDLRKDA